MADNYADFYNGSWDNINSNRKPHKNEYGQTDSIFAKEPLNKPESSAIRLLLPLSLLGFPEALRVSRGLVQKFPNKIVFTGTSTVDIVGGGRPIEVTLDVRDSGDFARRGQTGIKWLTLGTGKAASNS